MKPYRFALTNKIRSSKKVSKFFELLIAAGYRSKKVLWEYPPQLVEAVEEFDVESQLKETKCCPAVESSRCSPPAWLGRLADRN